MKSTLPKKPARSGKTRKKSTPSGNADRIAALYAGHVSPGKVELYTKYGLLLIAGERTGSVIRDIAGKPYFNCHCNGGVFNLGHRNRRVIAAVTKALQRYDIGNHHLVSEPRAKLAGMIAATMPDGLDQVVYGVSGGEAVDLAIKLARAVTGRTEIISARGGYHGHTGLALATGDDSFKSKFGPPAPGFRQIPFDDIEGLRASLSTNTAAVIFETIPATAGIVVPGETFYRQAADLCRQAGALLILDEIQTGFGRTGALWGFQKFGVVPDMVTLGKGMSGGIYPMSATVFHRRYAWFFKENPFIHISTFGGSEAGCFAAMEVLSQSNRKSFLGHVEAMGSFFRLKLTALGERYPELGLKVRGMGLMMGLKFKDQNTALFMVKIFFDNGLYTVYSGNDPSVVQFLPTLVVTRKEAGGILAIVEKSFKTMAGHKA